jgi:CHAT domain-containing protein
VSAAPSAFVRSVCNRRAEQQEGLRRRLLIVVDPESQEEPLVNADLEAAAITRAFPSDEVALLTGADATKTNVLAALHSSNFVHFACHGTGAALGSPLETGLLLAPDDLWLAAEILQERPIEVRLVVASACETGVIQGGTSATDEVISLASVFLAAGAAACIATLWSINDYTTALLMTRFYEALAAGAAPATALREAQLWLRDLTDEEEAEFLGVREVLGQHKARSQRSADFTAVRRERPYASRVYWAPFVFSGA